MGNFYLSYRKKGEQLCCVSKNLSIKIILNENREIHINSCNFSSENLLHLLKVVNKAIYQAISTCKCNSNDKSFNHSSVKLQSQATAICSACYCSVYQSMQISIRLTHKFRMNEWNHFFKPFVDQFFEGRVCRTPRWRDFCGTALKNDAPFMALLAGSALHRRGMLGPLLRGHGQVMRLAYVSPVLARFGPFCWI